MARQPSLIWETAKLALADIVHEKRMSLCMILAVMAIASPLLLFFGLKNGTVTTLRQRLLNDPAKMEILPKTSQNFDDSWFETWRSNPLVSFVVPKTRSLAAPVGMENLQKQAKLESVDTRPTGPGDTLLLRYEVPVPASGQMALTARVAKDLGVQAGDTVKLEVTRTRKGHGRERATFELVVAGVLPPEASGDNEKAAYMPLAQVEAIEEYKSGRAVAAYGWPGEDPLAPPKFDTLLVWTRDALDGEKQAILASGTGFVSCEPVKDTATLPNYMGLPPGGNVYRLATVGGQATMDNVTTVQDRLRGTGSVLLAPLAERLVLQVGDAQWRMYPASGIDAPFPGLDLPKPELWQKISGTSVTRTFLVSPGTWDRLATMPGAVIEGDAVSVRVNVAATGQNRKDEMPNAVSFVASFAKNDKVAGDMALAPCSLVAVLTGLAKQPLVDGQTAGGGNAFLQGRRFYANFRMYARGLEQVAPLASELRASGIEVDTSSREIGGVLTLDKTLNDLFLVIASASLFGGLACLGASIVASVDRKRKDLAILGLLGVSGLPLQVFPIVSVLTITLGGLLLALGVFNPLSWWINNNFSQLGTGERYCALSLEHQLIAVGIGLGLALIAGLFAAHRLTGIEPSEALRDE